jgi:hypothetical protein
MPWSPASVWFRVPSPRMKISGTAWSPFSKNCRFGTRPRTSQQRDDAVLIERRLVEGADRERRLLMFRLAPRGGDDNLPSDVAPEDVCANAGMAVDRQRAVMPSTEIEVLMVSPQAFVSVALLYPPSSDRVPRMTALSDLRSKMTALSIPARIRAQSRFLQGVIFAPARRRSRGSRARPVSPG